MRDKDKWLDLRVEQEIETNLLAVGKLLIIAYHNVWSMKENRYYVVEGNM